MKNRIYKLISSLLILAFIVSCMSIFAYADAPVVLSAIIVTKDANGAIVSTDIVNNIIDPLEATFVPVEKGQTAYLWYGGKLITGTSAIPVCAPISK